MYINSYIQETRKSSTFVMETVKTIDVSPSVHQKEKLVKRHEDEESDGIEETIVPTETFDDNLPGTETGQTIDKIRDINIGKYQNLHF